MRVISGNAKGHKLIAPQGADTRPTTDRIKESIFNIIQHYMPCDTVLDLFAGTGGMGIESLSRGCGKAYFVDRDRHAIEAVKKNLEHTKLCDRAFVHNCEWDVFLKKHNNLFFDLVFLDPPYKSGLISIVMPSLVSSLAPGAIVVCESDVVQQSFGLEMLKTVKYGTVVITILGAN